MLALIILIILIVIFLLLPVGASVWYEMGIVRLSAKAGPIHIPILPQKEKKRARKEKPAKKEKTPKKDKPHKKPDLDTIFALIKLGLRALGRLRRKLSIDCLHLDWLVAAEDPYDATMQYGYISAAVGTLFPLADRVLKIRDRQIRINVDFQQQSSQIQAKLTATLQIWEILYIALAFGIEYLISRRKLRRQRAAEERMDTHGKPGEKSDRQPDGSDHVQA